MARLFKSSWAVALLGCLLYLATTAALLRPQQFAGVTLPAQKLHSSPNNDPSWRFRNPEFEQWVEELKSEKENLTVREQQLREFQNRLEAERAEMLAVTQAVHQLQVDFDKNFVRLTEQEMDYLKRQTKIIAAMSPEGAAAMLKQMPDDQAVRILFSLKPDITSSILDMMSKLGTVEAKRAAYLTDRLRRVLPPASNAGRSSAPTG